MQIDVKEASRLLGVSETAICRLIKRGDLPAPRINDLSRFDRLEFLEWATSPRLGVSDGPTGVISVDLFLPRCLPHPLTLLDSILRLLGREG